MAEIDLSKMQLDELKKLQKDVAKAIDGFNERQKQEALAAAEAAVKGTGFTLADLLVSGKKSKATAPAIFRHPENPSVTWTGRGRQPAWIKEGIEAGRSKEDFLISK